MPDVYLVKTSLTNFSPLYAADSAVSEELCIFSKDFLELVSVALSTGTGSHSCLQKVSTIYDL